VEGAQDLAGRGAGRSRSPASSVDVVKPRDGAPPPQKRSPQCRGSASPPRTALSDTTLPPRITAFCERSHGGVRCYFRSLERLSKTVTTTFPPVVSPPLRPFTDGTDTGNNEATVILLPLRSAAPGILRLPLILVIRGQKVGVVAVAIGAGQYEQPPHDRQASRLIQYIPVKIG